MQVTIESTIRDNAEAQLEKRAMNHAIALPRRACGLQSYVVAGLYKIQRTCFGIAGEGHLTEAAAATLLIWHT